MNIEYLRPFMNATVKVIHTMAFVEPVPGEPFLKQEERASEDISGVIGMTGDTDGSLSVCFGEGCILALVSNMFGDEITELNEEVEDAVGEITNMICGDARRELSERGVSLRAAIPQVITGKDHRIRHISSGPCLAVPFETPNGRFTIEVCFAS